MIEHYVRALKIDDVLQVLDGANQSVKVLAGGTDLLLQGQHGNDVAYQTVVDISDIPQIQGIRVTEDGIWIGAATKLADIEASDVLAKQCPILVAGAREVGSLQIRHLATLGGNICNASPSADTLPALFVLEASVKLVSHLGERLIPLASFFTGPGSTIMERTELLTEIFIPAESLNAQGTYIKLKTRQVLDLAFVGVAVLNVLGGNSPDVRIALGAVAPTPVRAKKAELLLAQSQSIDKALIQQASQAVSEDIAPISDVRASAAYRREMAVNLTRRALEQVISLENDE